MLPAAMRVRTILATSSHVELGLVSDREVLPGHLVDSEGGILLPPGVGSCWDRLQKGEESPQLHLIATDVTSVPQPDRVRARVRLRGRVTLVPTPAHHQVMQALRLRVGQPMARFTPDRVVLELPGYESTQVPLTEYAESPSDPLAGWESVWIAHLDGGHAASLRQLAQQQLTLTDTDTVRALQADSSGLTVRVYRPSGSHDLRFTFESPARCGCRAVAAFEHMVTSLQPPSPN